MSFQAGMPLMTWCPGPPISPHHCCSTHHDADRTHAVLLSLPWLPHVPALATAPPQPVTRTRCSRPRRFALVIVSCLRTRCSCPPSPAIPLGSGRPQSRQQASAAATIGRDGAAGAWLLQDNHYHSCRLRVLSPNRILYVAYTRTRTYDVRRMVLAHRPAAAVTSDYDAVSS